MITFFNNNYKSIFLIAFFAIILLFLKQCDSTKNWKLKYETNEIKNKQNIKALTDSLSDKENKNGDVTFEKALAGMSKEELKESFPDLFDKLEAEFGDVKTITHTVVKYIDTGSAINNVAKLDSNYFALNSIYYSPDSNIFIDATNTFRAEVDTSNFPKVKLNIKNGVSKYNAIEFKTGFTTGIKKNKEGVYNIFLTPDSKSIVVTSLEGADVSNFFVKEQIISKRKRFSIGPYIGYGAVFAAGNKMYHGVSVGASIQYSIVNF